MSESEALRWLASAREDLEVARHAAAGGFHAADALRDAARELDVLGYAYPACNGYSSEGWPIRTSGAALRALLGRFQQPNRLPERRSPDFNARADFRRADRPIPTPGPTSGAPIARFQRPGRLPERRSPDFNVGIDFPSVLGGTLWDLWAVRGS